MLKNLDKVDDSQDEVLDDEDTLIEDIDDDYKETKRRLVLAFFIFIEQVKKLKAQYGEVTREQLQNQTNYYDVIAELEDEIGGFSERSSKLIYKNQRRAVELAIADGTEAIQARYGVRNTSSDFYKRYIHLSDATRDSLFAKYANKDFVKEILQQNIADALSNFEDKLINPLLSGEDVSDVYNDFLDALDEAETKAFITATTELNSAYRETLLDRYRVSGTIIGYRWKAILDEKLALFVFG